VSQDIVTLGMGAVNWLTEKLLVNLLVN